MTAEPGELAPGRPRPPRFFALSMALCLVLGFGGTMDGCNALQFYRSDAREDPPLPDGDEAEREQWRKLARARWAAYDQARSTQIPLAAANLVLSAMLLIVSWRALQGRPGTRALAAQAVAANGAFAAVEYALSAPMRAAVVGALVEHVPRSSLRWPSPPPMPDAQLAEMLHQGFYFLLYRAPFGFKLLAYAISLLALTRPSARAYLEDVGAGDNAEA